MKTDKLMLCVIALMLPFTIAAATAADAPKLTFKFTKVDIPGALETHTNGVNNAGVMVGSYRNQRSEHGYILDGKKLTKLDVPKSQQNSTIANGLNPNGAISVVGVYNTPDGVPFGFLYKNGKYTDIPGPEGALQSSANSINDNGAIVGWYVDSNEVCMDSSCRARNTPRWTCPAPLKVRLPWASINGAGSCCMGILRLVRYQFFPKTMAKPTRPSTSPGRWPHLPTTSTLRVTSFMNGWIRVARPTAHCCRPGNIISLTTPRQYSLTVEELTTRAPS